MTFSRSVTAILLLGILLTGCAILERGSQPREVVSVSVIEDGILGLAVEGCNGDLSAEAQESPTEVVVTVMGPSPSGDDCLDSVRVLLEEPLADRAVVDGSTGRALSADD